MRAQGLVSIGRTRWLKPAMPPHQGGQAVPIKPYHHTEKGDHCFSILISRLQSRQRFFKVLPQLRIRLGQNVTAGENNIMNMRQSPLRQESIGQSAQPATSAIAIDRAVPHHFLAGRQAKGNRRAKHRITRRDLQDKRRRNPLFPVRGNGQKFASLFKDAKGRKPAGHGHPLTVRRSASYDPVRDVGL